MSEPSLEPSSEPSLEAATRVLDQLIEDVQRRVYEAEVEPLGDAIIDHRRRGVPPDQAVPGLLPAAAEEVWRIIRFFEECDRTLASEDVERLEAHLLQRLTLTS